MLRVSWAGCATLAVATGAGFFAGETINRHDPVEIRLCDSTGELCDAPPTFLAPPRPLEEIDLTCLPDQSTVLGLQSMEPPLADSVAETSVFRLTSFELPVGSPAEAMPPIRMPYLLDEGEPAPLPPLGDVPLLTPVPVTPPIPEANNPIFQSARKFVEDAARLPDVTDKVPLGKPPVSEHPSAFTPGKPVTAPQPKPGTTEVRPGDQPPKPSGDHI